MIILKEIRIKGRGIGTEVGIPTININITDDNVELGLHACVINIGGGWDLKSYNGLINISILNEQKVGEIHIPNKNIIVEVGEIFITKIIKKIRDFKKFKDREKQFQNDLEEFKKIKFLKCTNCNLCYSEDYGYSNWTVEGTNWGCFAEERGEKTQWEFGFDGANNCTLYSQGEHWEFDVDGECQRPTDEELKKIIRDTKLKFILGEK